MRRVWLFFPLAVLAFSVAPTHYINNEGGMIRGVRGLSHQIGLSAIDRAGPNPVLVPGMVFTVEPKLYVTEHGCGIMIEDEVLVTGDGAEVLSLHSPETADAIKRMMRMMRMMR